MKTAKEFKFKFMPRQFGFAVVWDMDFCGQNMDPGAYHVIEKSAYDKVCAENEELMKLDYWQDRYKIVPAERDAANKRIAELEALLSPSSNKYYFDPMHKYWDEAMVLQAEVERLTGQLVMQKHDKMLKRLAGMDGFAACNLAEPSPGDLNRIYVAYSKCHEELRELKQKCAGLVEALKIYEHLDTQVVGPARKALSAFEQSEEK